MERYSGGGGDEEEEKEEDGVTVRSSRVRLKEAHKIACVRRPRPFGVRPPITPTLPKMLQGVCFS